MNYILFILLGITLFQDVKYRGVHWSVFPLLLIGTAVYRDGQFDWLHVGYNLIFLIVLMSALTLYLSLKQGVIVNITRGYFSWGDILFLLAIIPLFELRGYMVLFVFGTIATLLIHSIVHLFKKQKSIPYAGYMAMITALFILFKTEIMNLTSAI
ncbi:MAG: hypothetical protein HRT57_15480 [Crocinitomicaceae bacterium]|nr:hypothetical protein [Crocinitomicaceae bacterium]